MTDRVVRPTPGEVLPRLSGFCLAESTGASLGETASAVPSWALREETRGCCREHEKKSPVCERKTIETAYKEGSIEQTCNHAWVGLLSQVCS